jgi:translation initiation factor 5A
MSWKQVEVRELREGGYVNDGEEPCKILSIETSKPGKHGAAKARIEAMGLFDGNKRSILTTVTAKVQVPMIDKRTAQIINIIAGRNEVNLMDMESYEQFDCPFDEELRDQLEPGKEIQYMVAMGRRKITRT